MTTPYTFQMLDVRQAHKWAGRALLAHEQGLGKTFSSFLYAFRHPEERPIVVVCPATVKYNWAREGMNHFGFQSVILEGTRPIRDLPKAPVYIINYDILGRRHAEKGGPGWLKKLRSLEPRLLVLDECQYLGSRTSLRTRCCKALSKDIPHILALSGTPLTNRPAELWPTLNILRPEKFPNFYSFGHHYCGAKKDDFGHWDFSGASNLKELHSILTDSKDGVMLRRRKVDVLQDLPEKTRSVIPVPLSDPGEYRSAIRDFKGWLIRNKPGKAEAAWRSVALTRLGYLKRLAAELKLPSVIGWIDDYLKGSDGKLIVFGIHHRILLPLVERYEKLCTLIDGSVTGKKRLEAEDRFNTDPRCRLMIGNIQAAGTGWSARDCSTTLFAELDWKPGSHAQASDRTHGIARGREGYVSHSIYLVARDTIEESLCDKIYRKQQTLNAVLDGGEGDDFNLKEELLQELEEEVA